MMNVMLAKADFGKVKLSADICFVSIINITSH